MSLKPESLFSKSKQEEQLKPSESQVSLVCSLSFIGLSVVHDVLSLTYYFIAVYANFG